MPRTGEKAFNYPLAEALRGKHPRWRVEAERSAVLQDGAGLTPDIVIRHPGGAPVVVETEWEPAATVEDDARARLGAVVGADGQRVEQAVAVAVPEGLRTDDQARLAGLIAEARFRYCVLAHREGEPADPERWPRSGWIEGGVDDLAGLIEQTALSERRIEEGMRILEDGVRQAAATLRSSLERDHPAALERIAGALRQEDGEQTSRMAMAIVANALTFHTAIAGGRGSADALGDTPLAATRCRRWRRPPWPTRSSRRSTRSRTATGAPARPDPPRAAAARPRAARPAADLARALGVAGRLRRRAGRYAPRRPSRGGGRASGPRPLGGSGAAARDRVRVRRTVPARRRLPSARTAIAGRGERGRLSGGRGVLRSGWPC